MTTSPEVPVQRATIDLLAPAFLACDARGGPFHTGFDAAFDDLVAAARSAGVAVFVQSGAFAGGHSSGGSQSVSRRTGSPRSARSIPTRSLPVRPVPVACWGRTRCPTPFRGWKDAS
jgi:hypothetical protein